MNILSTILHDRRKTAYPIMEEALPLVETEVIPHIGNWRFDFLARATVPILENSFQHAKGSKVTRAYVGRIP
jgi:hypothetical protein